MQGREPDNSTNLLLAVVLSLGVLLVWQFLFPPPKRPATAPAQQAELQQPGAAPAAGPLGPAAAGGGAAIPGAGNDQASPGANVRIPIETPSLQGSIGLKGARIDDIVLTGFHETANKSSPLVRLFSSAQSKNPYFAEQGFVPGNGQGPVKLPDRDTVWSASEGATLTPTTPLKLTWDNGEGLTFTRTISVDENYLFTVIDEVANSGAEAVVLKPYSRIYRYGTPLIEGFFIQHEGFIGWLGEARLVEVTYADVHAENKPRTFPNVQGGWLGFGDKYWASAIIPDQQAPFTAVMWTPTKAAGLERESYQAHYEKEPITIAPGGSAQVKNRLFVGAKKVGVVEGYEVSENILEFDYLVDWGWFWFITKPLYHMLDWLYKLFGNFGLAILATTVIVKIVFFPLANKAYESMANMKKLQPEMERLRDRYKDDKEKMQRELMALYQKEKINPLAGCLPILLQIPVFFALYKVLFVSIDMRHAPFYGWINDLSAPDPTSIFNLFGLLPFAVPEFLMVGAWPIIMGITMWLQMQLNPPQPDPTQQMIFNWMPLLFTFLLATFPAGLVIYWAWNNVLSLAQQYYIMKRQGADVPLMDNVKKTFASVKHAIPKRKGQ